MNKITTALTAGVFSMLSATAFACPQGATLTGGTGPNHKGGTCVSKTSTSKKSHNAKHEIAKVKKETLKPKHEGTSGKAVTAKAEDKTVSKMPIHKTDSSKQMANKSKPESKISKNAIT